MLRKRFQTFVLAAMTAVLAGASLPLYAAIGDDPPEKKPKIISTTPFSDKSCSGSECTSDGDGCVIAVYDNGTVRCLD